MCFGIFPLEDILEVSLTSLIEYEDDLVWLNLSTHNKPNQEELI